ncbi:putative tRNA threonylcarbamoyladenosine metabolic process [Lyophyllum shimeji]|uniref:tRNA threonylcarbamoyladenosine metabolic process n=1 Tax=Lyophyllum shimeji TaxID=47721 RepID=A0A9P3UUU0_LYOSH|nr:putative tRNA threonylcarbamoyladenosine metabolic process [Lyophyllum shimeji]
MSVLLTPPSTSHRRTKDKENRGPECSTRVAWSEENKIHVLQLTAAPKVSTATSASKRPPTKSILKKNNNCLLVPWPQEPTREVTPEPADPLVNLTYLDYPVSTIVQATDATELRALIEAYSVLMARLRTSVTGSTDVDASWPLFQPLRKHRDAFVAAVERDLGRALVDPAVKGEEEQPRRVLLPSPRNTPKKKRDGMTAEQVKYARDLCTTSHAVIRLLSVVFTLPALLNIFTHAQLRQILTALLAIPLADELPTPNARKTWALAIWLLQTQRLPAEVLAPAADRIALALCRGIEGELGKEGKKGSASDGLKAIHDLSIHLPAVFIPSFTHTLLAPVLATLLAPTLTLRTHAAHALGGFVLGATSLPTSAVHTHIASIVGKFLTTPSPPRQIHTPTASPTKPSTTTKPPAQPLDPAIVRTLRTTLQATEAAHVAHGPVWGTCVLASLLALLGREAMNARYANVLRGLVQLGLRHKKWAVRALTSVLWRVVLWVYVQPSSPSVTEEDGEGEGESEVDEEEEGEERRKREERERRQREEWWRLVASVTEYETGVCTLAAYAVGSGNLGLPAFEPPVYRYPDERERESEGEEGRLRRGLDVLYAMVCKDAATCSSAIDTMRALVGLPPASPLDGEGTKEGEGGEKRTLLPRGLFSAMPGLLSTEFAALKVVMNPLFDETPKAEDVRALRREEMGRAWVWEGLVKAWRAALGGGGRADATVNAGGKAAREEEAERERGELVAVWEGMVGMGLAAVLDKDQDEDADLEADTEQTHDPSAVEEFTLRAVDVIINHVLEDANLELAASTRSSAKSTSVRKQGSGLDIPGFTSSNPGSALAKLTFAHELWRVMCRVVPHAVLAAAAERLLWCLLRCVEEYTAFTGSAGESLLGPGEEAKEGVEEEGQEMNELWAEFCVDVAAVRGGEGVRAFWECNWDRAEYKEGEYWTCAWTAEERAVVWRVFVRGWMQQGSGAGWEGAVGILGVPFVRRAGEEEGWKFTTDDAKAWQELLEHAVATALDYGYDANTVLSAVAALVFSPDAMDEDVYAYDPTHIRLVDFLLDHLAGLAAAGDLRELPEPVLDFAAAAMVAAYPPPPAKNQTTYTWAARAVTGLVEHCPRELVLALGEKIGNAIAVWVGDAEGRLETGVIEYDILTLYQTLLVTLQGLPLASSVLQTFGPVLCAPFAHDAREEIRVPAVESFREFWDATYATVKAPKGGWGEDVDMCLAAAYPEDQKEEVKEEPVPGTEVMFVPRPSTPTPSTPTNVLTVPATPTTSCSIRSVSNTLSTPPRQQRSSRLFAQLPPQSPESPMPACRLSRPPTPQVNRTPWGSPAKRRKLANGNKENLSPVQERVIPSVLERILASPDTTKVTLGKRRFEEDAADSEDERSVSKSLVKTSSDDDVFFVRPTKRHIVSSTRSEARTDADTLASTPNTQRKRKRMFLDAVEVPMLSELYPRRRLRPSVSFEDKPVVCTPTMATGAMRRSVSESKTRSIRSDEDSASGTARKRRRGSSSSVDEESSSLGGILRGARRLHRSQSQQEPKKQGGLPSSELSSDDDPHIGQVTPHHLISPELRRGMGVDMGFVDPPSDDSVMASSPSRDLVQRRLQRLGSSTSVHVNVKPFVV